MASRMIPRAGLLGLALAIGLAGSAPAQDAALRDRVNQLVARLDADKAEARDTAEKALIDLGAKALPLLPDPAALKSEEQKQRVQRVRDALAAAQEKQGLDASIVTTIIPQAMPQAR